MKMKDFIFGKNGRADKKGRTKTRSQSGCNKRKYGEKSILRSINMQYVLVKKKDKNGNVCEIFFKPVFNRKSVSLHKDSNRFKLLSFSDSIK